MRLPDVRICEICVDLAQEPRWFAYSLHRALLEVMEHVPDGPFRIRFHQERPRMLSIVVRFDSPKEGS